MTYGIVGVGAIAAAIVTAVNSGLDGVLDRLVRRSSAR